MLSLGDLGLDVEEAPATSWAPVVPVRDPGHTSLREAILNDYDQRFQTVLANLGVVQASACLSAAVHQIWGRSPHLMPVAASIMAVETIDRTPVDTLAGLLRLTFPDKVAARVPVLSWRHGEHFLNQHLAWQGDLADEGVPYVEMSRRAASGEFDATGPLPSLFDIRTMTFRG